MAKFFLFSVSCACTPLYTDFASKMGDPRVMEQIAMYLVGLPCPPIPLSVDVTKFLKKGGVFTGEEVSNRKICSSHDILAGLIVVAMKRGDKNLNAIRQKKQTTINETFLDTLDALDESDVDSMYKECQKFTAEYLLAFDDPSQPNPSFQLHPMEDVKKGDNVHHSSSSWSSGQDILFEPNTQKRRTADQFKLLSYRDIIQIHCSRVKSTFSPFSKDAVGVEKAFISEADTTTATAEVLGQDISQD